jgi:uncharacterized membrane protein YkvA (DUF1232 family)
VTTTSTRALVAVAVVVLLLVALLGVLVLAGRRVEARELARFVPDCARLCARLAHDGRVSRGDRLLLVALGAYLALPIDLVPDVLPVAGQADDALLVGLLLRRIVRSAGPELVRERWPGSEAGLRVVLRLAGPPPRPAR